MRFLILLLFPLTVFAQNEQIEKTDKIQQESEKKEVEQKEASPTNVPVASKEEKRDTFNLTAYNPFYAIYHPESTKIQASFKYRLHRELNFYLGYTHLILWDLQGESRPFYDVNYNPELFYRWEFKNKKHIESIDFIGVGHTSNGQNYELSRSYDYTAVQFNFKYDIKQNQIFRTSLRLRYIGNFDEPNENLRDYYGPWELKFAVTEFMRGFVDKGELSGRIFGGGPWGTDFSKGGQEIGVSFRILGFEITPAFYLQYYHGYNESLRFFNQKENVFRFGLLF